jgi:hypothetical protein
MREVQPTTPDAIERGFDLRDVGRRHSTARSDAACAPDLAGSPQPAFVRRTTFGGASDPCPPLLGLSTIAPTMARSGADFTPSDAVPAHVVA